MAGHKVTIRKSIYNLSDTEKKNLVIAFRSIKKLPTDNPNSYWAIAGYHGRPYVKKSENDPAAGWCNHSNVLFPTWHRFETLSCYPMLFYRPFLKYLTNHWYCKNK